MSDLLAALAATTSHAAQERLIVLLAVGFAIGVFGHLIKSRAVIAVGVAIFFLASFLIPALLYG
ncbi:MAG: hypothetical protein WDZ37_05320 [Solirubrobacterales bacterium]